MLFSSTEFLFLFLPITLLVVGITRNTKYQLAILLAASLFFYASNHPPNLIIMLGSILINYLVAKSFNKKRSFGLLSLTVALNLGLLVFYKYNFYLNEYLFNPLGYNFPYALPLAISFFTFQSIAFVVDAYRKPEDDYNLPLFALFISFFPQLIAGPIVHHNELIKQFTNMKIKSKNIKLGLAVFALGLIKKVILADGIDALSAPLFANILSSHEIPGFFNAWKAMLSYSLQIYFDFSGYSDMAYGLAVLFNLKLPVNFNSPYKSLSIVEFWRRWHITLSTFLRDYLYIPLGGNRKGQFNQYRNVFIVMFLGGLWHGGNIAFGVWGFLHGLYISINHLWNHIYKKKLEKYELRDKPFYKASAWFITMVAVVVAWVFFRINDFDQAIRVLKGLVNFSHMDGFSVTYFAVLGFMFFICTRLPNIPQFFSKQEITLEHKLDKTNILFKETNLHYTLIYMALGVALLFLGKGKSFIYFKF